MVRYRYADCGRDGADHATGRLKRLYHQFDGARRADDRDLQGCHSVLRLGHRPGRGVDRVSGDHAGSTQFARVIETY